ncbi:MAG TPA: cytochrome c biogenesis protein CcdA [Vicinamibacterales bacterium]|nr:cytochrome c biogenesis protein CcdA [Vicinamibacterales bacterium]
MAALTVSPAFAQQPPPPAELTPLTATDAVHPGEPARIALQVKLADRLHTNSNKPRDQFLIPITLALDVPKGVSFDEVVFPSPVDLKSAGSEQPLSVFTGTFAIGATLALDASVAQGDLPVTGTLHYQACDEQTCYPPKTLPVGWVLHVVAPGTKLVAAHKDVFGTIAFGHGEKPAQGSGLTAHGPDVSQGPGPKAQGPTLDDFTVVATNSGYLRAGEFQQFVHDAESGVQQKGMFEGHGPLAILLIVFVGGLALNLTPCVLPMIPINLAIIGAGAKAGSSRSRGFLLGGVYGAAMAVVYGVLGLIVILTAGTFGTINATWWFNAGIAALFLVLALAMFDVITIDFSGLSSNINVGESSRGSFLVAFGMGAVAALLAGACVAPVVVEVVLFSSDLYSKGTASALALPFVLGLGMALPWPIAGAGISAMPKPGAWMVRVKQVFGVIILVMAGYYGYETYDVLSQRWADPAAVSASVQEQMKEGWHQFDEGLAAAKQQNKPVLIDMWATWCKNCLTMDQTTLKDAQVNVALANYVKIKFQAEDPDAPATKATMERLKAVGLPTYVILHPNK